VGIARLYQARPTRRHRVRRTPLASLETPTQALQEPKLHISPAATSCMPRLGSCRRGAAAGLVERGLA